MISVAVTQVMQNESSEKARPIRNKSAVIGLSYCAGIVAAAFTGALPAVIIGALCIIGAFTLGVIRKAAPLALTLFVFGAGGLVFTVYDINIRQPIFEMSGKTLNITGRIIEKKESGYDRATYVVKANIDEVSTATKLLLTAPDAYTIGAGDTISAEVTLSELRDVGVFPERSYYLSRGILIKGDTDGIIPIKQSAVTPLDYIRDYNAFICSRVNAAFPNDVGGLLRAVFLGDKSGLPAKLMRHIKIAGAAHYTAVSGLHITMITHMFMLAFALTPFRNNRRVKFSVLTVTVLVLAVFFNMSVSVVRSAIMLIIFYGGELFMRKGATLNSLGAALFLIVLFSPYAVFDAGLIMSFSGTLGAGVLAPALLDVKIRPSDEQSPSLGLISCLALIKQGSRKLNKIVEGLIVSSCAGLCVLPASAIFFKGVSILSPLTSVIIMPFFTIAAGAMILFALLAALPFSLGQAPLLVAGIVSKIINGLISFLGKRSIAWISLDYWFVPFWLAFAIITVFVIWLIYKNPKKVIKAASLAVAGLALMLCVYRMNVVNSGKVYISVYSDGTSAWVGVEQYGVKTLIVTEDTPKAAESLAMESSTPAVVALLRSTRNNRAAFLELPALKHIPPDDFEKYDISGVFTLEICKNETTLIINEYNYKLLLTPASNDNAPNADVTVAYNRVVNKRSFNSDYTIYASRSVPAESTHEKNAYYEPVYLILERY